MIARWNRPRGVPWLVIVGCRWGDGRTEEYETGRPTGPARCRQSRSVSYPVKHLTSDGPTGSGLEVSILVTLEDAKPRLKLLGVRAFALVELGDSEAIDLFLREEDARRALEECLRDEPGWIGTLFVELIELDERNLSAN
jgi:hypothetical protein